jgi:hypothetical protein
MWHLSFKMKLAVTPWRWCYGIETWWGSNTVTTYVILMCRRLVNRWYSIICICLTLHWHYSISWPLSISCIGDRLLQVSLKSITWSSTYKIYVFHIFAVTADRISNCSFCNYDLLQGSITMRLMCNILCILHLVWGFLWWAGIMVYSDLPSSIKSSSYDEWKFELSSDTFLLFPRGIFQY